MFDIDAALNDTFVEIEIEHVVHIAAQITNVENEPWVIGVDIAILVSLSHLSASGRKPSRAGGGRHRGRPKWHHRSIRAPSLEPHAPSPR